MTNSIDAVYRMFLAKVYRSISSDFTKEEMRKMIAKEENKILKGLGTKGALTAILAMFGIANF